jgi:hypothetical protein
MASAMLRACLTLLGPLLAAAGFALYFAAVSRWALWERIPWEFLAISAAGALWSVAWLARGPGLARGAAAGVALAASGFSGWYLLSYSMLGPREDVPRVGDALPAFELPASDGGSFRLADARGRWLILLFYRGDW